jgi:VanZ family protein
MNTSKPSNKLATTSLTLGIVGWIFYIGQWCFDFTIGLLLTVATGGIGAICSTVLDLLPFVLWLVGIVTGHAALAQVKQSGAPGRGKAIWGLVLNYSGMFFLIALIVLVVVLLALGIGSGWLEKLIPISPHLIQPSQSG